MKHLALALAFIPSLLMGQPRAPYVMRLDENKIHPVPIHTETDTLLMFPEEVSLILGHHLTKGEQPGKVYCQQAENGKFLILRQLEKSSTVLMQVVMSEQAYVFKLSGSKEPATSIRFYTHGQAPPAIEIAADKLNTKRTASDKRVEELVRLAREAAFLKLRIPNEYEGFQSRRVSFSSQVQRNVTATITGLARFGKEDVLIVLGVIRNDGPAAVTLKDNLHLKIHDARLCVFTRFDVTQKTLKPGEQTGFRGALLGNVKDNSHQISINNRFAIEPKP